MLASLPVMFNLSVLNDRDQDYLTVFLHNRASFCYREATNYTMLTSKMTHCPESYSNEFWQQLRPVNTPGHFLATVSNHSVQKTCRKIWNPARILSCLIKATGWITDDVCYIYLNHLNLIAFAFQHLVFQCRPNLLGSLVPTLIVAVATGCSR